MPNRSDRHNQPKYESAQIRASISSAGTALDPQQSVDRGLGRCWPVSDDAFTELEVGLREVVPDSEQRFSGELRGRVGHTVAEVEGRGVVSAAKPLVGALGCVGVVNGEFDHDEVDFTAEAVQYGSGDWAVAGGEHDEGFGEGGGGDGGVAGTGQDCGDLFGSGFTLDECDERRGVNDQRSGSSLGVVSEDLLAFGLGDWCVIRQEGPDFGLHDVEQVGDAVAGLGFKEGELRSECVADGLGLVVVAHAGG